MTHSPVMIASCACGSVEVKALGKPIVSAACYCDDCQKGAAQLEALPNAPAVRDPGGGTAYVLYRKDRFECSKGAELLKSHKLKDISPTNRVVATCCNSADDVPSYRSYPPGLMVKLLASRIAMTLGR